MTGIGPLARQWDKPDPSKPAPMVDSGALKKELAERLSNTDKKYGGIPNLASFVAAASSLPLYAISKSLTRFLLLAAYHDTIEHTANPGLIVSGKAGVAPCFTSKCVETFNNSLSSYLEAVDRGAVDAEIIDSLIGSLGALRADAEEGRIAVEISIEQWDALVGVVADYTSELAEANSVELGDFESAESESEAGRVIDLRRYLAAQRQIFEESACDHEASRPLMVDRSD